MKNKTIPDSDYVARFCKPSTIEDGEVQATAFLIRPTDKGLSVNWLEYLKLSNREKEITKIQGIYSNKFTVSPNAKIAIVGVGPARKKVFLESHDKRNLLFKHDPAKEDPSHSGIFNLKEDDEMIAELILSVVDQERHVYRAK